MTANHRANDVIVKEGNAQTISGRFMYGPLDVVSLTGERVDIYCMQDMDKAEWTYLGSELTDKNGRIHYTLDQEHQLPCGVYPFKMVVR